MRVPAGLALAAALVAAPPPPAWCFPVAADEITQRCCKRCSAGKPCGDSCIARDHRCTKPPGCAC